MKNLSPDELKKYNAEKSKRWRERHPEKAKAISDANRVKFREKRLAETAAWRERNRDKLKEYQREYDKNREEKRIIYRREQYAKNKETIKAAVRQWQKDNPDKKLVLKQRRRARQYAAFGSFTAAEANALLEEQNWICANPYCLVDLHQTPKAPDHIVALVNGGANSIDNIQWLCVPCNSRKNSLSQVVWLEREKQRSSY